MSRALAPLVLVTLVIEALQLAIFSSWRIAGVVIMVVWLWPLAMGLAGYTGLALITALVAGIFFDTHATTPFGLTTLVALVLAWSASRLGREGVGDLDSAAWWVTPLVAAIGGLAAPVLYVLGGFLVLKFDLWRSSLLAMMAVNGLAFFVLARPMTRLARAVGRIGESRR